MEDALKVVDDSLATSASWKSVQNRDSLRYFLAAGVRFDALADKETLSAGDSVTVTTQVFFPPDQPADRERPQLRKGAQAGPPKRAMAGAKTRTTD